MPSTRYDVYTEFRVRDHRLRSSLKRVSREARDARTALDGITSGFGRMAAMGAGVLGGVGLYAGARKGKQYLIDYNNRMEQMRMSTAGATSMMIDFEAAGGDAGKNYVMSMEMARSVTKELQKDAAALVGTTEDFSRGFGMLIGPMAQTGLAKTSGELKTITREMVGLTVAGSAALLQGDVQQGLSDIMRMLLGQAGAEMRMAQVLQITGKEAERFNKLPIAERYREIYNRLVVMKPAFKDFENSWEGLTSTFADKAQIMLGKVGEPVFGRLKSYISDANTYLTEHEAEIDKLADAYGNRLGSALDFVLTKLDPANFSFIEIGKSVLGVTDNVGELYDALVRLRDFTVDPSSLLSGALDSLWKNFDDGWWDRFTGQFSGRHVKAGPADYRSFNEWASQSAVYLESRIGEPDPFQSTAGGLRRSFESGDISKKNYNKQLRSELDKSIFQAYQFYGGGEGFTNWANRTRNTLASSQDASTLYSSSGSGFVSRALHDLQGGSLMSRFYDQVQFYLDEFGLASESEKIKPKREPGTGGKKAKVKKEKIVQNFNGPVRLELHLDNLEQLEPDRIAVVVQEKINQDFLRGSTKGLSGLLKVGSAA